MSRIIYTTDEDFEKDITTGAVLVDFYADWCQPCKMIGTILDEIAEEYDGRLQVIKINIEENSITSSKFSIRTIPTLTIFQDGEAVGTKVGSLSKSQLVDFIDNKI